MARVTLVYPASEARLMSSPPLALGALKSALMRHGHSVRTVDHELLNWYEGHSTKTDGQAAGWLHSMPSQWEEADVLGLSLMGPRQLPAALALAEVFKTENPAGRVVMGGVFPSGNAELLIGDSGHLVDHVVVGDGEKPLLDIVSGASRTDRILRGGKTNALSASSTDPGALPYDMYTHQARSLYKLGVEGYVYQFLMGRGCPRTCSYCGVHEGGRVIMRPADEATAAIIDAATSTGAAAFSLICNQVNPSRAYLKSFLDALEASPRRVAWGAYAWPGALTLEDTRRMRDLGCVLLRFGVETASQRILDSMGKSLSAVEVQSVIRATHDAGIWTHANFIAGYPHEREEDLAATQAFIQRNGPWLDSARINPFFLNPSSVMYQNPSRFAIEPKSDSRAFAAFDELDGLAWGEKRASMQDSVRTLVKVLVDNGVGFHATLPDLVIAAMTVHGSITAAKSWLDAAHPYLREDLSPEEIKWRLDHPDEDACAASWVDMCGMRIDRSYARKANRDS